MPMIAQIVSVPTSMIYSVGGGGVSTCSWGCIITLYKNPYPWMSLSLYFLLIVLPRKMRYRYIFFLSFFHGKPSKPNTDMSRLNLTARGYYTVPVVPCMFWSPARPHSLMVSPPSRRAWAKAYMPMHMHMYECMYVCMHVCMYIMYVCMCIYIYRYVYTCIYIYIYIYTYIHVYILCS